MDEQESYSPPNHNNLKTVHIKALEIPEILILIFDALCSIPRWKYFRTLLSCTLVHSSWHDEANRRLWDQCGKNDDVFNIPSIEHLLKLDISVRQKFANYIRCIYIANTKSAEGRKGWQGQFLPRLASLSFPNLQELYLEAPKTSNPVTYDVPILTQFAQPKLQKIQIRATLAPDSFGVTEEWLILLAKQSQYTTHFHYSGHGGDDAKFRISPTTFLSFLKSMTLLESLEWEINGSMSQATFAAMARLTSLRCLRITSIADAYLQDLQISSSDNGLFQSLTELRCEISANALDRLVHHFGILTVLSLRISKDTTQVLEILSHSSLRSLEELRLQPSRDSVIQANNLLKLANNFPQLTLLDMAWRCELDDIDYPIIQDFGDDTMEDMATLLTKLETICLISAEDTDMTERSLLFLGQHCPNLSKCSLTAVFDFANLADEGEGIVLERLVQLLVYSPGMHAEREDDEVVLELSQRVKGLLPALLWVNFETDWQMQEALNTLIRSERV